jgi:hypothetical protein
MRGSIEFETYNEFFCFVAQLADCFPYAAAASKSHIRGQVRMVELLLEQQKAIGEGGYNAINDFFLKVDSDKENVNFQNLIKISADKENMTAVEYGHFRDYTCNSLTGLKNSFSIKALALQMKEAQTFLLD